MGWLSTGGRWRSIQGMQRGEPRISFSSREGFSLPKKSAYISFKS